MARYQAILVYDGTQFRGFQRQSAGPGDLTTVQGNVESALRKIGWRGRSIRAAGRTDSGVHARGQVIAFDLDWNHSLQDLRSAVNAYLPMQIAIREVREAAQDFHPRFDALSRRYCYHLFCQPVRDPLRERYAWRVWPAVLGEDLQSVAGQMVGKHDFAAFGTPPHPAGSTEREVFKAAWLKKGDNLVFEIEANAFLYRMVRRLVYVQVAIAQKKLEPDLVQASLQNPPHEMIQGLAPPQGLFLVEVLYPAQLRGLETPAE
ncbi:MAG: tRNA pseudouridine(38-40) synthase TruA [Anaerolineales bacterium]